jgi:ABC-type enterochelin transport system permease subunit
MTFLILFEKQIFKNVGLQSYGKTMRQVPNISRVFLLIVTSLLVCFSFNLIGMVTFLGLGASLLASNIFKGKNKHILVATVLIVVNSILFAEFIHSFISRKIVHGVSVSFISIPVVGSFLISSYSPQDFFKKIFSKERRKNGNKI